ncbi:LCP family protein [Thermopolyspora sp. NPDC052614]|uniref:LCP family glycopolymer transferase n=1 Tax=Thermopolyspora sp. NPDC052614 TaxID=3155682 RepID=UPI00344AD381
MNAGLGGETADDRQPSASGAPDSPEDARQDTGKDTREHAHGDTPEDKPEHAHGDTPEDAGRDAPEDAGGDAPEDAGGDAPPEVVASDGDETRDEAGDVVADAGRTGTPGDGRRPRRRRRVWLWSVVATVLAVVLAAGVAVAAAYVRLSGNIRHTEIAAGDLGVRPEKVTDAVNILIVGSDERDGKNAKYGHRVSGRRTDTIILAHLSPDRDDALLVSFPRDSLVRLPSCPARDGLPGQREHTGMINAAFAAGGIGCLWKTIESLTGIHIDHFVKVDFIGFKEMVDALGGVEMCLPEPIRDRKALLDLPAGHQTLDGERALGYVRTRYGAGDGSDIGRIERQQLFIGAMVRKATSGAVLTDPARLYRFLDAATRSVTTDPDLTPGVLRDLAESVRGLDAGGVRFVTTPWRYSVASPGRVEWVRPDADRLFEHIAQDRSIDGVRGGRHDPPPRDRVRVVVRDGTGRKDGASSAVKVAAELRRRGYQVDTAAEATGEPYRRTTIEYGPAAESGVLTLVGDVREARRIRVPGVDGPALVLVIGKDWKGLTTFERGRQEIAEGVTAFDATRQVCPPPDNRTKMK